MAWRVLQAHYGQGHRCESAGDARLGIVEFLTALLRSRACLSAAAAMEPSIDARQRFLLGLPGQRRCFSPAWQVLGFGLVFALAAAGRGKCSASRRPAWRRARSDSLGPPYCGTSPAALTMRSGADAVLLEVAGERVRRVEHRLEADLDEALAAELRDRGRWRRSARRAARRRAAACRAARPRRNRSGSCRRHSRARGWSARRAPAASDGRRRPRAGARCRPRHAAASCRCRRTRPASRPTACR